MQTRCKCCNLPNGLKNALNTSLIDGIPYRSIISQINPLLPDNEKLIPMNLSKHKRHMVADYINPDTGLSLEESDFLIEFAGTVRTLALRQAELVAEYQHPDSKRGWQHISGAVDTLKKLWAITQESLALSSKSTVSKEEVENVA
jgi:hypothetical protein